MQNLTANVNNNANTNFNANAQENTLVQAFSSYTLAQLENTSTLHLLQCANKENKNACTQAFNSAQQALYTLCMENINKRTHAHFTAKSNFTQQALRSCLLYVLQNNVQINIAQFNAVLHAYNVQMEIKNSLRVVYTWENFSKLAKVLRNNVVLTQ